MAQLRHSCIYQELTNPNTSDLENFDSVERDFLNRLKELLQISARLEYIGLRCSVLIRVCLRWNDGLQLFCPDSNLLNALFDAGGLE